MQTQENCWNKMKGSEVYVYILF